MSNIFYIDCEFNGLNGDLLSIALVDQDLSTEFYEVLEHDHLTIDPWVNEHVIPFLGKPPVSKKSLQEKLSRYLPDLFTIVADWPDDIRYFCELLITGPGKAIDFTKCFFVLDRNLSSDKSKIPHNALEDARAIRAGHFNGYVPEIEKVKKLASNQPQERKF